MKDTDQSFNPSELTQRLQDLPLQHPPEDRLRVVLDACQADLGVAAKRNIWPWAAIAAGLLIASSYALLQRNQTQPEDATAGTLNANRTAIEELRLASQLLESHYQVRQQQARHSFANRDFQYRGELILAELDQALQSAPDDESLWQQRVEVLNSMTQAPDLQARGFQPVVLKVN